MTDHPTARQAATWQAIADTTRAAGGTHVTIPADQLADLTRGYQRLDRDNQAMRQLLGHAERACQAAADRQGLTAIRAELDQTGIPHTLRWHTGGRVAATVPLTEQTHLAITRTGTAPSAAGDDRWDLAGCDTGGHGHLLAVAAPTVTIVDTVASDYAAACLARTLREADIPATLDQLGSGHVTAVALPHNQVLHILPARRRPHGGDPGTWEVVLRSPTSDPEKDGPLRESAPLEEVIDILRRGLSGDPIDDGGDPRIVVCWDRPQAHPNPPRGPAPD